MSINRNKFNKNKIFNFYKIIQKWGWGLGIGDWGLGIGDWGLGPIPNPQSPIPILNYFIKIEYFIFVKFISINAHL